MILYLQVIFSICCNMFASLGTYIQCSGKCFSKTILHLLKDFCKSVSCDLQLESTHYSIRRDLMLYRIHYINIIYFIQNQINAVNSPIF